MKSSLLCQTLAVSVSGYYVWRKRPICQRKREDGQLSEVIRAASHGNREVYGNPRVHAELWAQGIKCSRKRLARLMRNWVSQLAVIVIACLPPEVSLAHASRPTCSIVSSLPQRPRGSGLPMSRLYGRLRGGSTLRRYLISSPAGW